MTEINPLVTKFIRAANPTERAAALAACAAHRASSVAAKPRRAQPPVATAAPVRQAQTVAAKSKPQPKPDDGSDVLAMVRQCGLKGFNHDERRA